MRQIIREAYAKINLGLDVVGRREDGYHLVRMIMQEIGVNDTLTVTAAGVPEGAPLIRLKTDSTEIPIGPDNLVCHAAYIMCEAFDIRDEITIDLQKRIPVAAGLAGGSTDAAAVFMALRDLYAPSVTDGQLQELALPLGADIPYCIAGGTRLSEGIGEKLIRLPDAPQCCLVLVKPPVAVNTGMVYRTLDGLAGYPHPDIDGLIDRIAAGDLTGMADKCGNVLELVTGQLVPVIGQIEQFFMDRGAVCSKMSGSGPSVFAIYQEEEKAAQALREFKETADFSDCYGALTQFVYR